MGGNNMLRKKSFNATIITCVLLAAFFFSQIAIRVFEGAVLVNLQPFLIFPVLTIHARPDDRAERHIDLSIVTCISDTEDFHCKLSADSADQSTNALRSLIENCTNCDRNEILETADLRLKRAAIYFRVFGDSSSGDPIQFCRSGLGNPASNPSLGLVAELNAGLYFEVLGNGSIKEIPVAGGTFVIWQDQKTKGYVVASEPKGGSIDEFAEEDFLSACTARDDARFR